MTHGEKYFYLKENIDFKKPDNDISRSFTNLPKKMKYCVAIQYYSKKIRDYFDSKLTVKDFSNVDDYYSFWEAKRIIEAHYSHSIRTFKMGEAR